MYRVLLLISLHLLFAITGFAEDKRIVLIAGPTSHYYGAHDFEPGCLFIAQSLAEAVEGVEVDVVTDVWPKDPDYFDGADAVIIYSDGLAKHVLKKEHAGQMNELQSRGVGIGFIHYACNVEKDELGEEMLNWIGGYYENFWSCRNDYIRACKSFFPITKSTNT